jgi:NAD(P)-dependent dehydrogenase (short-subunit alcohol dehydrogenase family)
MVTARGGTGIWVQVDHQEPDQVRSLFERVRHEQGCLDLLVNNMSGDQHLTAGMLSGKEPATFWEYPIEKSLATQLNGVHTHLITSACAAPMMVEQGKGLIVEITDGNRLSFNGVGVAYSFSKTSLVLLAYLMAEELRAHDVAVVSLTPGWLRSETMLDGFGVTEENWQDAIEESPDFSKSETPFYIGRAVVALATDPQVMERTGHALSAGYLAREYGFTDVDGRQPPGYAWGGVDIREGIFKDGRFLSLQDELVSASNST